METRAAAERFAAQFPAVYRRFCRRLAPTQYRPSSEALAILSHLADTGPLAVTEAARHMHRSQAAMSELLQRLVGRGLLARQPEDRDRRRKLLWLTPAGQRLLAEARRVLSEEALAAAFGQLTPRQRRTLVQSVQALLDTDPRPGGSCR